MDSDILKIEEIVMGGEEAAAPAEVSAEKAGKSYTTIIIQEPPVPPVLQSCKSLDYGKVRRSIMVLDWMSW